MGAGYYWRGWPYPGSIPSAGHLSRYVTSHSGQLSLAIPSWVGAMSTSQRAVMSCGWGVKAGMVRVWVAGKTVWSPCYTQATSECFRDKELIYKVLYTIQYNTIEWVFLERRDVYTGWVHKRLGRLRYVLRVKGSCEQCGFQSWFKDGQAVTHINSAV